MVRKEELKMSLLNEVLYKCTKDFKVRTKNEVVNIDKGSLWVYKRDGEHNTIYLSNYNGDELGLFRQDFVKLFEVKYELR